MTEIKRVGIDLAKNVFHLTAVDRGGAVIERKRLRRAGLQAYLTLLPSGCVVAMEACGSALTGDGLRSAWVTRWC